MRKLLVLSSLVLALAGCLRPRYAEFVTAQTAGPTVALQLLERATDAPVPNATIEMGELRSKVTVKTDAMGFFTLPVDPKQWADNPIIVVNAPAGVGRTKVIFKPTLESPTAPVSLDGPISQPVSLDAPAVPATESTPDAGN